MKINKQSDLFIHLILKLYVIKYTNMYKLLYVRQVKKMSKYGCDKPKKNGEKKEKTATNNQWGK